MPVSAASVSGVKLKKQELSLMEDQIGRAPPLCVSFPLQQAFLWLINIHHSDAEQHSFFSSFTD